MVKHTNRYYPSLARSSKVRQVQNSASFSPRTSNGMYEGRAARRLPEF